MEQVERIACLGPEVPATSATFVYNEMLDLRSLGLDVSVYSVHRPAHRAGDPEADRLGPVYYLYERGALDFTLAFFGQLFRRPSSFLWSLRLLFHDIRVVGVFSPSAVKLCYQFGAAARLAAELFGHGIQHLHVQFGHVPAQVGMYAAAFASVPFTFTTHANDIFRRPLLLEEKAARAKTLVTISDYNRRFLEKHGVEREKIAVVRCGVDGPPRGAVAQALSKKPLIGTLGRLVEKKGMDTLLQACAILVERRVEFELQIAGYGPLEDQLKNLCRDLGLQRRVMFLGSLQHDRVSTWLGSLSVFALACREDREGDTDGIPVVLMEAMAVSTPVVSTSISGIPELIEHGKSGLLARPSDPAQFAEYLVRVLAGGEDITGFVAAARDQVTGEFSRTLNARRMYRIITGRDVA